MPEGHTIHGLARSMAELVGHQVAASSPQGRFPADTVDGAMVHQVEAYGKHLLLDLSTPAAAAVQTVHVHLGMRGKWLRFSPVTGPAMRQVRLRLARPDVAWDLIAPTTCELLAPSQRQALVERLGPDPLRPDADAAEAQRRIAAYSGSIGAAVMDQGVIAGVGNVFRAEALHACRIAPTRPAGTLTAEQLQKLWDTLQSMMSQGVEDGRIITVDAPDRLSLPENESRHVYKRDTCYDCGTPVAVTDLAGRTSYACPRCQPD
jgi:formamidopyrimidine-DNA glycosylase